MKPIYSNIYGLGMFPCYYFRIQCQLDEGAAGYFLYLNDMTPGKHKIDLKVIDLLKGNEGPPPKFDPPREGVFDINIK
jgi:hypothetical protein